MTMTRRDGKVLPLLLALLLLWPLGAEGQESGDALVLHFLDVGQGDALLVQDPSGRTLLYDGGPQRDRALEHLRDLGVTNLDLVVASHPHLDHIGGLPRVLEAYEPTYVLDSDLDHTTQAYERYLEAVQTSGAQLLAPEERSITLGTSTLHVMPPPGREEWGLNDNSVGLVLEYGEFRAVLPGDAETDQWEWWLEEGHVPQGPIEVHKASHHGSHNGDTPAGMERLRPETVLIGVGADNPYDHPHSTAMALYEGVGAEVYRTDLQGTIRITAEPDGRYVVEPQRAAVARQGDGPDDGDDRCVDINKAPIDELQGIVHIGRSRAQDLIALRGNQRFEGIEDLTRVPGIGPARVDDIIGEGLACLN